MEVKIGVVDGTGIFTLGASCSSASVAVLPQAPSYYCKRRCSTASVTEHCDIVFCHTFLNGVQRRRCEQFSGCSEHYCLEFGHFS